MKDDFKTFVFAYLAFGIVVSLSVLALIWMIMTLLTF